MNQTTKAIMGGCITTIILGVLLLCTTPSWMLKNEAPPQITAEEAITKLKMAIVPPKITPTAEQVALEEKASRLHIAVSDYITADKKSAIEELKTVLKK